MNAPLSATTLHDANQQALAGYVTALRQALVRREPGAFEPGLPDPRLTIPALGTIAGLFGLSRFEAETLVLAAAPELDGAIGALCAAANGDPARPWPNFGLALALLSEPHWSALLPDAPLRRWRLIDVDTDAGLVCGRLRTAEAVLHRLAGLGGLDERLAGWVRLVPADGTMPASHAQAAESAASHWRTSLAERHRPPSLRLSGPDPAMLRAAAAEICARAGLLLLGVSVTDLPTQPDALAPMLRLLERDARLTGAALLVEGSGPVLAWLVDEVQVPLLLAARDRSERGSWGGRRPIEIPLEVPDGAEARELWQGLLPSGVPPEAVERVLGQFRLPPAAMRAVAERVARAPEAARTKNLWEGCRAEAGLPAANLAERVVPRATWDQLVLPEPQTRLLRMLATQVRQRTRVLHEWGFADTGSRGLGIAALFAGPSGTGKGLAAEVIAAAVSLDLYRIDLSRVVSKWLGETEKHLAEVFDAAEAGGAVLLFDEADSLFGKRSEVRDSHDRYANIEVSFLLQRLEAFRGLAVLTTNSEQALDGAFVRRLRCIVRFPQPDAAQRAAIWERVLPARMPVEGLRPELLARLMVAGGTIRNIALTAAYLAAEAGEPLRMGHMQQAAEIECAKLNRPLSAAETAGWT